MSSSASNTLSQLDIAPTAALVLGLTMPPNDGTPIRVIEGWDCQEVLLIIIDGLGYSLYLDMADQLHHLPHLAESGCIRAMKSVSVHTSPAIASILSGLLPEHHCIRNTEDAKASEIKSLPEIAATKGIRTAVIMEKEGAEVYEGLIDFVGPVAKGPSPREFDRRISHMTLEALSQHSRLTVCYFIGLDRAAHLGWDRRGFKEAILWIDGFVGDILDTASPGTLVIVVGDHAPHAGPLKDVDRGNFVAFIMGRVR